MPSWLLFTHNILKCYKTRDINYFNIYKDFNSSAIDVFCLTFNFTKYNKDIISNGPFLLLLSLNKLYNPTSHDVDIIINCTKINNIGQLSPFNHALLGNDRTTTQEAAVVHFFQIQNGDRV